MNLDDLPLEIINEIATFLPYDDYLNFIEAYPLAYDIMLLRKYNTKYEHEIIKYDNSSKDEMVIREIRKVGRIKIVIKEKTHFPGNKKEFITFRFELLFGDSIIELFFSDDYRSECTFRIDDEFLKAGHTKLKLVDEELDLIEELIDCYGNDLHRYVRDSREFKCALNDIKWMNARQKIIQYE